VYLDWLLPNPNVCLLSNKYAKRELDFSILG
jgi:hypothetical protein